MAMKSTITARRNLRLAIAPALLLVAACARTVVSEDLSAFAKASDKISQQSQLAFAESNKLARDVSVDRFVRSHAPGLSEDQFQLAVTKADIEAWDEAFTALADYGDQLASLVDSGRGTATSDAVLDLGTRLNAKPIGANIGPGVAAGFASLAGILVDLRGQQQARAILQRTDPAIQRLLSAMAESLGDSDGAGLRGTVQSNWNTSFTDLRRSYAAAATRADEAVQRKLIADYLAGLDRRDAQLRSLANLRASIIALAAAHGAAAKGGSASIGSILSQIDQRLDETKRLYKAFEHASGKKGDS